MSKHIVSVRMDEELWEKLRDLADYEARTVAGQVHYMIRKSIESKEQNQLSAQKRAETRASRKLEAQKYLEKVNRQEP